MLDALGPLVRVKGSPIHPPFRALDRQMIACPSSLEISRMTPAELARVIRASKLLVLRPEIENHLAYYDRPTLERLVYLARRCCRNRND